MLDFPVRFLKRATGGGGGGAAAASAASVESIVVLGKSVTECRVGWW